MCVWSLVEVCVGVGVWVCVGGFVWVGGFVCGGWVASAGSGDGGDGMCARFVGVCTPECAPLCVFVVVSMAQVDGPPAFEMGSVP